MPIMHQLTAAPVLLFCAGALEEQTLALRRLSGQGPALKVAVQTANLGLNGHFLCAGRGACLAERPKPASVSRPGSE